MVELKEKKEGGKKEEEPIKKKYKCKYPDCDFEADRTIDLARHVRLEHKAERQKEQEAERQKEQEAERQKEQEAEKQKEQEVEKQKEQEAEKQKEQEARERGRGEEKRKGEVEEKEKPKEIITPTPVAEVVSPVVEEPVKTKEEITISKAEVVDIPPSAHEIEFRTMPPEKVDRTGLGAGTDIKLVEVGEGEIKPAGSTKGKEEEGLEKETKETLVTKLANAKKWGFLFEGPMRKSLRKWMLRRQEEKEKRKGKKE